LKVLFIIKNIYLNYLLDFLDLDLDFFLVDLFLAGLAFDLDLDFFLAGFFLEDLDLDFFLVAFFLEDLDLDFFLAALLFLAPPACAGLN